MAAWGVKRPAQFFGRPDGKFDIDTRASMRRERAVRYSSLLLGLCGDPR
jgi:hypothetical protein